MKQLSNKAAIKQGFSNAILKLTEDRIVLCAPLNILNPPLSAIQRDQIIKESVGICCNMKQSGKEVCIGRYGGFV